MHFHISNNTTEYEGLLAGLRAAIGLGESGLDLDLPTPGNLRRAAEPRVKLIICLDLV